MTPHDRILHLVAGATIIGCLSIGLVLVQTAAAATQLQADEAAAHNLQALGDQLLVEVHEQREAIDEYLLSTEPEPLARFRRAVADETRITEQIRAEAGNESGVASALASVAAQNDVWLTTIAEPAIAAVQGASSSGALAAIQAVIHDSEGNVSGTDQFVLQLDAVEAELGNRSDALSLLRVTIAAGGGLLGLIAAGLTLWFARRDRSLASRESRRRIQSDAERSAIIASLRTLRTEATPEATAGIIAAALGRLPCVDGAALFECTDEGVFALAVVGLSGFPMGTGDAFPPGIARSLLRRSGAGPWADRWTPPTESSAYGDAMTSLGVKSWGMAPVEVNGELVALVGIMTTDDEQARRMIEDLPAIGEFASVAQAILAPALLARRERTAGRRRVARAIDSTAFRAVFQPVVELASGRIVGFEALTRFDDGSPPDITFAAAVGCGMGLQLELATMEVALRDALQLPLGAWLGLNVSPALLAKSGGTLTRMLGATGRHTVIEVTEHDAIDAYGPLRAAMVRLGPDVKLAVDDAGAGVANFNHLVELRPDFVKIDVGLVRGVDMDPGRQAVVAGLVHFAARTGSQVIAEGIETEAERAMVAELGVTLGQGYLLARPASVETWAVVPKRPRLVVVRPKTASRTKRPTWARPAIGR